MKILFDRIDCFQFDGEIGFEELWAALGQVVSTVIDEIQGYGEHDNWTNNLHDGLLRLDDEREQRRAALVERGQRRAAERAGRGDDGEGELLVLLSQAVR